LLSAVEPSKAILTILLILGSKLSVKLFAAMPALICPVVPKNVNVSLGYAPKKEKRNTPTGF